jgi:hypothetical protein
VPPSIVNLFTGIPGIGQKYVSFQAEKQVTGEGNKCSLKLYNLSETQINVSSFRFNQNTTKLVYGAFIIVRAGYVETGLLSMFTGVITDGYTTREGADYVTYIDAVNISSEIKKLSVTYIAPKGQPYSKTIVDLIASVGGIIAADQLSQISARLAGEIHEENESYSGSLGDALKVFQKSFNKNIDIYFDEDGAGFVPIGKTVPGRPLQLFTPKSIVGAVVGGQLIGSPRSTRRGLDFDCTLNASIRLNDPVKVISELTARLAVFDPGTGFQKLSLLYVANVNHSGDNRDGEFKTSISAYYPYLVN